ncbi:MAG: BlaI/MecI/CopY family transcriptional regulator [Verrucomicrobia bacterium]|nr:BlaI/MecI/CopY family transcriptional regulator [Verrucomicrobiota bacterium]
MPHLPKISEAEWEVMKALWQRSPQTANELAEAVAPPNEWNPLTVKTLINRLVRKKAIGRTKQGRAFLFHPLIQQADCAVAETESFVERVFNGSLNPMLTFLVQRKKLSRGQIAELKKILEEEEG